MAGAYRAQALSLPIHVRASDGSDYTTTGTPPTVALITQAGLSQATNTLTYLGYGGVWLATWTAAQTNTGSGCVRVSGTGIESAGYPVLFEEAYTVVRSIKLDNLDAPVTSYTGVLETISQDASTASQSAQEASSAASGIKARTDNLPDDPASNTQVNTRLATTGYTAPPTAAAIVAGVWNELAHTAPPLSGDPYTVKRQVYDANRNATLANTNANNASNTATNILNAINTKLTDARLNTLTWLNSMIEQAGSSYRFNTNALSQAPTGSGGGGGGAAPVSGDVQWVFELVTDTGGRYSQLAISTEHVRIKATAKSGLRTLDPTAYTIQFAFQLTSVSGTSNLTWTNAAWDEDGLATLLVGPSGGAITLPAGAYNVFVRIANAPETTIRRAGSFIVE